MDFVMKFIHKFDHELVKQIVVDSVLLANMIMKDRYDAKHKPVEFNVGD